MNGKRGKNEGWAGIDASPEIKARLKVFHRYIRKSDLHADGLDKKPHVTLAYGLSDNITDEKKKQVMDTVKGLKLKIVGMSSFNNKDRTVLKLDIDSDGLRKAHKYIESNIGIPGKTFKDYKPHMTIAHLKPGADIEQYRPLERLLVGKEFPVSKVRVRIKENEIDNT